MEYIPKHEIKVFSKEGELLQEFRGNYLEYLNFTYEYRTSIKCEMEHLNQFEHIIRLK